MRPAKSFSLLSFTGECAWKHRHTLTHLAMSTPGNRDMVHKNSYFARLFSPTVKSVHIHILLIHTDTHTHKQFERVSDKSGSIFRQKQGLQGGDKITETPRIAVVLQ